MGKVQLRARVGLGKGGKVDAMVNSAANPKCPLSFFLRALRLKQPHLLCPDRFLCVSSPSFLMALGVFGHHTMEG